MTNEGRDCGDCKHADLPMSAPPCYNCRKHWVPKTSGIDILMTCGETHHIDTEQPSIESVKVNGEQVYPQEDKKTPEITTDEDFAKLLSKIMGKEVKYEGWGIMDDYVENTKAWDKTKDLTSLFAIPWSTRCSNGYTRFRYT